MATDATVNKREEKKIVSLYPAMVIMNRSLHTS